jgi:hypothetical protein
LGKRYNRRQKISTEAILWSTPTAQGFLAQSFLLSFFFFLKKKKKSKEKKRKSIDLTPIHYTIGHVRPIGAVYFDRYLPYRKCIDNVRAILLGSFASSAQGLDTENA